MLAMQAEGFISQGTQYLYSDCSVAGVLFLFGEFSKQVSLLEIWDAVTFSGPEDRYHLLGSVHKDIKRTYLKLDMCFVIVLTNITVNSKSSSFLMGLEEYSH